jgi:hypothetical protein
MDELLILPGLLKFAAFPFFLFHIKNYPAKKVNYKNELEIVKTINYF